MAVLQQRPVSNPIGALLRPRGHRCWRPASPTRSSSTPRSAGTRARRLRERGQFLLHDGEGIVAAAVYEPLPVQIGRFALAYPAVGDWVAVAPSARRRQGQRVPGLLPRRHGDRPPRAGRSRQRDADDRRERRRRVHRDVASNADLNLRRVERSSPSPGNRAPSPSWSSPKADLDDDVSATGWRSNPWPRGSSDRRLRRQRRGRRGHSAHLAPGRTVAFIGSSGVGKSTLVNALPARSATTAEVREDDARGRHTTTRRELVPLADGLLIDTPGMREMALNGGDGIGSAFETSRGRPPAAALATVGTPRSPAARCARPWLGRFRWRAVPCYGELQREAQRSEVADDAVAPEGPAPKWSSVIEGVERHVRQGCRS